MQTIPTVADVGTNPVIAGLVVAAIIGALKAFVETVIPATAPLHDAVMQLLAIVLGILVVGVCRYALHDVYDLTTGITATLMGAFAGISAMGGYALIKKRTDTPSPPSALSTPPTPPLAASAHVDPSPRTRTATGRFAGKAPVVASEPIQPPTAPASTAPAQPWPATEHLQDSGSIRGS